MNLLRALIRWQLPVWFVTPLLGVTLMLGLGIGYIGAVRLNNPCPLSAEECRSLGVFWQAWRIARDNFVDETAINSETMAEGAVTGMLDSLGDVGHTRFLSAEAVENWNESMRGSFEGIGAYVDVRDGQPIIVAPIEGSPAERAGLRPNDAILRINGEPATDLTIEEVVARVRGPAGTTVVLTILHEGEELPVEISITRAAVDVPSVSWRMLDGDVAHVLLRQFNQDSSEELTQALQAAQDQGASSIVLDLRNNPGGYVHEMVAIASQFLPEDSTVLIQEDREGDRELYTTNEGGVALEVPLVVLVNANSASAAEILAGALQYAERAQIIGVPTAGTGTVLVPYNLEGGAQILLGVSQWLTPAGELVRGEGITPDVLIALPPGVAPLSPSDAAALSAGELQSSSDLQLARALEELEQVAQQR